MVSKSAANTPEEASKTHCPWHNLMKTDRLKTKDVSSFIMQFGMASSNDFERRLQHDRRANDVRAIDKASKIECGWWLDFILGGLSP
jgi:hypothetical protein